MADEQPPPRDESLPVPISPETPPVPYGAIMVEQSNAPPIVLNPAKKASAQSIPKAANKDSETKDTIRELMETVVFVVVLVLMLKTFLAEAFVIPTGSMADTLLGYHYKVTCPQCGYRNLVNASSEAEPQRGEQGFLVVSGQCQNCGETNTIRNIPQARHGGQP